MPDPYRDELVALREENERLRRELRALRGRRARPFVVVLIAAIALSFVALQGIRPLLNAPSDARFWAGVVCAVVIVAADVACALAVVAGGLSRPRG